MSSTRQRIADLAAYLSADTREYEAGMLRASKSTKSTETDINRSMAGIQKAGLKLGLGLVGGGGALAMLTNEIRSVITNIEKIPGIPQTTIDSVNQAKYAFAESRVAVDQAIAGVISFTSWTARAAGFLAGSLVYGLDAAEQGYWDMANAAARAANEQERQAAATKLAAEEAKAAAAILARVNAAQDKTTTEGLAAIERLAQAKEAYAQREESQIERMNRLRSEANKTLGSIMPGQSNAGSTQAQAKAYDKLTEAAKIEKELVGVAKQHLELWQKLGETIDEAMNPVVNQRELYENAIKNLGWGEEEQLQRRIMLQNGIKETKEASAAAHELGWAFSSAFEDAILSGEKLSDVVRGLGQDILRIALRTAITAPIGNAIGMAVSNMFGGFGFGGGKAVGGPVAAGMTYLVGEKGPELFTPQGAGTIVPNHRLAEGSGGGSKVFHIDARGADRAGMARLESLIRQLDGSIEMRAVAATYDHRRRGAHA